MLPLTIWSVAVLGAHLVSADMSGEMLSSMTETSCNRALPLADAPGCVWNSAVDCESCAGVCVVDAPESNIYEASVQTSQAATICSTLAGLINMLSRETDGLIGDSEFASSDPVTSCPSSADVLAHFADAMAWIDLDDAEIATGNQMTGNALNSAEEMNSFFANRCEDVTVSGYDVCRNTGTALADETTRLENIAEHCTAAATRVANGECLSFLALMHADKECLMAHEVSTVSDATATSVSDAYAALHTACAALTTEEECTGASVSAEVAAATSATDAVEMPPAGALPLASAGVLAVLALLAALV